MQELRSLLDLPIDTLAVLAAGYLGYRLAYIGRDRGHRPVDVLFISLAFAFIASLTAQLLDPVTGKTGAMLLGVAATIVAAAFWRSIGSGWTFRALRAARISDSDHHVTAWDTVRQRRGFRPTVLIVRTTDGELLMCHKPEEYGHLRDGPFILGDDGSVAMFVTDRCRPGKNEWEERETFDDVCGYELTYLPAGRISEIRIKTSD